MREAVAKPNEEFTAEKIVDMALRQDIGYDPMNTARERIPMTWEQMQDLRDVKDYAETKWGTHKKNSLIGPGLYFNQEEKKKMSLDDFLPKSKKTSYKIPMPIKRQNIRKNLVKSINPFNINWRNTEFIHQFVSSSGYIRSRLKNRIGRKFQKKIAREVKTARIMNILSSYSFLKPMDKVSLRTLEEDLEAEGKLVINLEHGGLMLKKEWGKHNRTEEKNVAMLGVDAFLASEEEKDGTLRKAGHWMERQNEEKMEKAGVDVDQLRLMDRNDLVLDLGADSVQFINSAKRQMQESDERDPKQEKESFDRLATIFNELPPEMMLEVILAEKNNNDSIVSLFFRFSLMISETDRQN